MSQITQTQCWVLGQHNWVLHIPLHRPWHWWIRYSCIFWEPLAPKYLTKNQIVERVNCWMFRICCGLWLWACGSICLFLCKEEMCYWCSHIRIMIILAWQLSLSYSPHARQTTKPSHAIKRVHQSDWRTWSMTDLCFHRWELFDWFKWLMTYSA